MYLHHGHLFSICFFFFILPWVRVFNEYYTKCKYMQYNAYFTTGACLLSVSVKALFTRYVLTDMFQSRPKDILLIRAFTRYVRQSCL